MGGSVQGAEVVVGGLKPPEAHVIHEKVFGVPMQNVTIEGFNAVGSSYVFAIREVVLYNAAESIGVMVRWGVLSCNRGAD
jgi:hypothetical protein